MKKALLVILVFISLVSKGQCTYDENNIPSIVKNNEILCINNDKTVPWGSLQIRAGGIVMISNNSTFTYSGSITVDDDVVDLQGDIVTIGGRIQFMNCDSKLVMPFGSYRGDPHDCELEVYNCNNPVNPFTLTAGVSDQAGWCKMTTLPVELTYFESQKNENERCIYYLWQTVSEINNDYFEILVSKNGFVWNSISTVPGNGNSFDLINYKYKSFDLNYSYAKLKQVDFDGTASFSKIVYLGDNNNLSLKIIGNTVIVNSKTIQELQVHDTNGTLLHSKIVPKGLQLIELELDYKGMVILTVGTETRRFFL